MSNNSWLLFIYFPLAILPKPQVLISCQHTVLMWLAFIPHLWLAVTRPCTGCLSPKETSTSLLHAKSGSDGVHKCCFLVYQFKPHGFHVNLSPSTYECTVVEHTAVCTWIIKTSSCITHQRSKSSYTCLCMYVFPCANGNIHESDVYSSLDERAYVCICVDAFIVCMSRIKNTARHLPVTHKKSRKKL